MTPGFLSSYVLGLLAVGLMLFGLYGIARLMTRARFSRAGRWLQVIESVPLGPNCALHVVKAGEHHLLIATGSGQTSLLAQLGHRAECDA